MSHGRSLVASVQIGARPVPAGNLQVRSARTIVVTLPPAGQGLPPNAHVSGDGAGPAQMIVTLKNGASSAAGPRSRFTYVDSAAQAAAPTRRRGQPERRPADRLGHRHRARLGVHRASGASPSADVRAPRFARPRPRPDHGHLPADVGRDGVHPRSPTRASTRARTPATTSARCRSRCLHGGRRQRADDDPAAAGGRRSARTRWACSSPTTAGARWRRPPTSSITCRGRGSIRSRPRADRRRSPPSVAAR